MTLGDLVKQFGMEAQVVTEAGVSIAEGQVFDSFEVECLDLPAEDGPPVRVVVLRIK